MTGLTGKLTQSNVPGPISPSIQSIQTTSRPSSLEGVLQRNGIEPIFSENLIKTILIPANKISNISNMDKLDANIPKVISAKGSNENITGNKALDTVTEGG